MSGASGTLSFCGVLRVSLAAPKAQWYFEGLWPVFFAASSPLDPALPSKYGISDSASIASPPWCRVVQQRWKGNCMPVKGNKRASTRRETSIRASVSFPRDVYGTLAEIAKGKRVSVAWVVREAAEQYIADKWPLFKGQG